MAASHGNYKYPRDEVNTKNRAITQQICDDCGVIWRHKFKQYDLFTMIEGSLSPEAKRERGACQIFTTMFMHIREMNKDYPNVARRLFKYWVFMNDKKLTQHEEITGKTFTPAEKKEWQAWKESFGKSDNNNNPEADDYQKFMSMYFATGGGKQIIKKVNEYWNNYQAKLSIARQTPEELVEMQTSKGENNQPVFKERSIRFNSNTAFDLDFMHSCNADYFLDSNRSYKGKIEDLAEAMAYEIYDCHQEKDELRLLVTITGNEGHSISFTRFKDDPGYIEFCDANRGEFLIPYNDREKFKEFFKKYFQQDIYKPAQYNSIYVESYGVYPPEQRQDPKIQQQLQNIEKRSGHPTAVRNAGSVPTITRADIQPNATTSNTATVEKSNQNQSPQTLVSNQTNQTSYPGLLFNESEKNAGQPVTDPFEEFVQAVDKYLKSRGIDIDSLKKERRGKNEMTVGLKIMEMKNNDANFKRKFEGYDEVKYLDYKYDLWAGSAKKAP